MWYNLNLKVRKNLIKRLEKIRHFAMNQKKGVTYKMGIARHGFEPRLQDPESRMIDHYTTGLR